MWHGYSAKQPAAAAVNVWFPRGSFLQETATMDGLKGGKGVR